MPWLHSSNRYFSFFSLKLKEDLFKLLVGQRNWKLARLGELNDLEFESIGEFWFNHFEVREALPGFG